MMYSFAAPPPNRNIPSGFPYDTIPHIVDGGSWKTSFVLVNNSASTINYKIDLMGPNHQPRTFPIVGKGLVSNLTGSIAPYGSSVVETEGTASTLVEGWAQVSFETQALELAILAIFRQRVPGRPDFEATVTATTVEDGGAMPFDNTGGYVTGIAVINPGLDATPIPVEVRDEAGNMLVSEMLQLQPGGGKLLDVVTNKWPATANKRGTISFPVGLHEMSILGFRFNPTGAFTTLPVLGR